MFESAMLLTLLLSSLILNIGLGLIVGHASIILKRKDDDLLKMYKCFNAMTELYEMTRNK